MSPRESSRARSPASAPVAPVTERGAKTRTALVKAARALFEKQGYLDTNVGDISRRARVAHGTFYTYFTSKEEIFAEVADALVEDLQRIANAEPPLPRESTLADRIERSNRGYLRGYQENARMMAVLEQVATFNTRLAAVRRTARRFWVQRNSAAIRRWQEQGLVDAGLDAQYAASALGSMIDRSAYVWIVLQEPYEFERAVEQLTRLYCNALRVPYHPDPTDAPDIAS